MIKKSYLAKRFGLAAVAIALCMSVGVGTTFAYYTDSTYAEGTVSFNVDTPVITPNETPGEDEQGLYKNLAFTNDSAGPVIVRVKAVYLASDLDGNLKAVGENWGEKDGWLYYNKPLFSGQTTDNLKLSFKLSDKGTDAEKAVTIIHESMNAKYVDVAESDDATLEVLAASFPSSSKTKDARPYVTLDNLKMCTADGSVSLSGVGSGATTSTIGGDN